MKIKQIANLPAIAASLKIVAASSLAVGVVAGVSAAPASAVVIAPGSVLAFNDGLLNTSGTLTPGTTGSTFQGTFTGNGAAIVSQASGTFASIFAAVPPTSTSTGAKFVTSNPVTFQQVGTSATVPGGIDYAPTTALTFNFGSGGILTVPTGSRFLYSPAVSTGTGVGRSNFNIYINPSFGGTFTNGSDVTNLNFTSFSFDVDNFDNTNLTLNPSPNGSFSLVATVPAAVPEPFTIIGTIIGGTAAFRMRKKLSSSTKN
jgi:hypothetical protein